MSSIKKLWKFSSVRFKIGFFGVSFFLILGFIVYLIPHDDPTLFDMWNTYAPPSSDHFLGTTALGQDIFWLLINSIRNSIIIGVIVATIGTTVGVLVGLTAGYLGGKTDRVLSTITDTFLVIPSLPVLILFTSLIGGGSTTLVMAMAIATFAWAHPARQMRSMTLSMREREFVHTAKFSGESTFKIITLEILPYSLTWTLSNFMNAVLVAIGMEVTLAILGLSPAMLMSLGNMMRTAQSYNAALLGHWYWIGAPVVTTVCFFVSLFMLITGYNDYLSVKRGR